MVRDEGSAMCNSRFIASSGVPASGEFLWRIGLIVWLLWVWPLEKAAAQDSDRESIAIVVHPGVPAANLSFAQVRKIFLGEQQFWSNRQRITLLMRAPDALERDVILEQIYEMSEGQFTQYWIAKIFRSEVTAGPKIVYSTEMAYDLVTALPGSITFVRARDVRDDVKVLRIDGKLPGEQNYPL